MSEQYKAALFRAAVIQAPLTFLSAFLVALAAGTETRVALIIAGGATLAPLVSRFGFEGTYDTGRNRRGDVKPSDVTA